MTKKIISRKMPNGKFRLYIEEIIDDHRTTLSTKIIVTNFPPKLEEDILSVQNLEKSYQIESSHLKTSIKSLNDLFSYFNEKEAKSYVWKILLTHLQNYILPKKNCALTKCTPAFIHSFVNYFSFSIKANTAQTYKKSLKRALKFAGKNNLVSETLYTCIDNQESKDEKTLNRDILSVSDIKKLEMHSFSKNKLVSDIFLLSLYTGLQWKEITNLKQGNINLTKKLIQLPNRKIELNNSTLHILKHYQSSPHLPEFDLVFPELQEKSVKERSIQRRFQRYLVEWGNETSISISMLNFRIARSTYIHSILKKTSDIEKIKEKLGISSQDLIKMYKQWNNEK